jgi:hypothetical protein
MDGPGLLPGEAEPVQQIEHAVLAVGHAETLRDKPAEVLGGPAADAVTLRIGTAQHQGPDGRHLPVVEEGWTATPRPIAQARDALGVEADHPVPNCLAVHPGLLRRLLTAHAVEGVRKREQSAGDPAIILEPCQPTQLLGRHIPPDRQRRTHPRSPMATSAMGNHILPQTTIRVSQLFAGLV